MKRSILLLLVSALMGWTGIAAVAQDELTFGVISDIHVGSGTGSGYSVKVPQALKYITSHGALDAIAVAGDLTDNGSESFFQSLAQITTNEANYSNPVGQMIFMMGNHDHYDSQGHVYYQKYLQPFNGGEDYPLHAYRVIKGHAFISLSMLASSYADAYPSASQQWLAEHLAKAAQECPGKPIFVFTHVPPMYTSYGTWPEIDNSHHWTTNALNDVLNQYPQVIIFGGHSHYPIGDPRSIHQGVNPESANKNYFTAINTGTVTYSEIPPGSVDEGVHPVGFDNVTEGMIVAVKDNGDVEIRRYDLTRGEEIGAGSRWTVRAPHDGSQFAYGDLRDADDNPLDRTLRDGGAAPVWETPMEMEVKPYSVVVTIPQAKDEECVFSYTISITDIQGTPVKKQTMFSQHYLNSQMPASLKVEMRGLRPEREYVATVVATDCYGNVSEAQEEVFETPEDDQPNPTPIGQWTFDDPANPLTATVGADLVALRHQNKTVTLLDDAATAGIVYQPIPSTTNASAFIPAQSGLKVPLSLDEPCRNYTLMMDIMVSDINGYNALFQANLTNSDDADLFINGGTLGVWVLGYNGKVTANTWHRVICVCSDGEFTLYFNGDRMNSVRDDRYIVQPEGFYIFTDDAGERKDLQVAEVAFWNEPFTEEQIMRLGNMEMGGFITPSTNSITIVDKDEFSIGINANVPFTFELPEWIEAVDAQPLVGDHTYTFRATPMAEAGRRQGEIQMLSDVVATQAVSISQIFTAGNLPQASSTWTFDDEANPLACDGVGQMLPAYNTLEGNVIASTLDEAGIVTLEAGPKAGNGAVGRAPTGYLWVKSNLGDQPLANYTLMMDVRPEVLAGDNALFLNSTSSAASASLFVHDNKVGTDAGGLGYGGDLKEYTWHRIVAVVSGNTMSLYVDGEFVSASASPLAASWELQPEFLLFADGKGKEQWTDLAEVRLWDMPLTAEHVKQLGAVEQDEPVLEEIPQPLTVWDFTNAAEPLQGQGPATLSYAIKGSDGKPVICEDPAEAGFGLTTAPEGHCGLWVPIDRCLLMNLPEPDYTTYTLMMDVRVMQLSGFQALVQTNTNHTDDADIFFNGPHIGVGAMGYHGAFEAQKWYRLAFVVDNNQLTIYANGERIGASSGPDSRWQLRDGTLLFSDNTTEEGVMHICGARLWTEVLTPGMVRRLGNPGESKPGLMPERPAEPTPDATMIWTFADTDNPLAAEGPYKLGYGLKGDGRPKEVATAAEANITTTDAPEGTQGALTVGPDRYLRLHTPDASDVLNTFTIMMDVRAQTLGSYQNLFQGFPQNDADSHLFIAGNNVGVNKGGLGYHGNIEAMKWHRITFAVEENTLTLYLDGEKLKQSESKLNEWHIVDGVLFFADNNGEEGMMDIAEMRLWETPLTDEDVAAMGKAGEAISASHAQPTMVWTFDDENNPLAAEGPYKLVFGVKNPITPFEVATAAEANITTTDAPEGTEGALTVPVNSSLMLHTPDAADVLNTFTIMMDVRAKILAGYQSLYQGNPKNNEDCSLCFGDNKVGKGLMGYFGNIEAMKWYRVVFAVEENVLTLYLDGEFMGQSGQKFGNWRVIDGVLFFADDNGNEGVIDVAEIRLWDSYLTDVQVATLGKAGQAPTGIHDVKLSEKKVKGIFDLLGRRLSTEGKGLRIIDGRKVMVK